MTSVTRHDTPKKFPIQILKTVACLMLQQVAIIHSVIYRPEGSVFHSDICLITVEISEIMRLRDLWISPLFDQLSAAGKRDSLTAAAGKKKRTPNLTGELSSLFTSQLGIFTHRSIGILKNITFQLPFAMDISKKKNTFSWHMSS